MTATIRINGRDERFQASTVAELLRARGITATRGVAVAVNGVVVPASAWSKAALVSGDDVEVVRPFGGG